ncbi:spore coat protein [Clostridium sp. DJ247]|uniref:spore coat protein n=1 Tax=Clostridium sp. DJ247 TaxID=2726188 RepID=UPI001624E6F8|nr:spore coat protein [Clostridium sp. DJ247]MBC2581334.1 spore coat protein [Clostridium sp. DJ247]
MVIERIAPHEAFEIHELLDFKVSCATKTAAVSELVSDSELKAILKQDIKTSKEHIQELQSLIQRAPVGATMGVTVGTTNR